MVHQAEPHPGDGQGPKAAVVQTDALVLCFSPRLREGSTWHLMQGCVWHPSSSSSHPVAHGEGGLGAQSRLPSEEV